MGGNGVAGKTTGTQHAHGTAGNQAAPAQPTTGKRTLTNDACEAAYAAHDDQTLANCQVNPYYNDASRYVDKFFARQIEIEGLFNDARSTGLQNFQKRASTEYNANNGVVVQLLELAIVAVPAVNVLYTTMKDIKAGVKTEQLMVALAHAVEANAAGNVAAEIDHTKLALQNVATSAKTLRDSQAKGTLITSANRAATEDQARGDFEIGARESNFEQHVKSVGDQWGRQDELQAKLDALRYSAPAVRLNEMVKKALGLMPNKDSLATLMQPVIQAFEYNLYYAYYVEGGRLTVETPTIEGSAMHEWPAKPDKQAPKQNGQSPEVKRVVGLPPKVLEWITQIGKLPEIETNPFVKHVYSPEARLSGASNLP